MNFTLRDTPSEPLVPDRHRLELRKYPVAGLEFESRNRAIGYARQQDLVAGIQPYEGYGIIYALYRVDGHAKYVEYRRL